MASKTAYFHFSPALVLVDCIVLTLWNNCRQTSDFISGHARTILSVISVTDSFQLQLKLTENVTITNIVQLQLIFDRVLIHF